MLKVDTKIFSYKMDFFLGKRLCVPQSFIRQSLVREPHEGGLMGHFGVAKPLDTLHEHFFGFTCKNPYIAFVISA